MTATNFAMHSPLQDPRHFAKRNDIRYPKANQIEVHDPMAAPIGPLQPATRRCVGERTDRMRHRDHNQHLLEDQIPMRVRSQIASKALIYAFATPICGWAAQGAAAVEADDAADNAPQFRPCSLEQVQSRKTLYRRTDISGVATPLLIHITAPSSSERLVRNGKVISFSSGNGEPAAQGAVPWRLETLDPAGRPSTDAILLSDGNMIRLRTTAVKSQSDKDPPLVIVKADVPDQNRPTTCDTQIRDGDFVFIHTISPSVWLSAAPAPNTPVPRDDTMPHSVLVNGSANPSCVQDSETCVTDKSGGLVCAWAPSCAR